MNDRTVDVVAIATDRSGVRQIQVIQDGKAVPAEIVEPLLERDAGSREVRLKYKLILPPQATETKLELQAVNRREVFSRRKTITVHYEPLQHAVACIA